MVFVKTEILLHNITAKGSGGVEVEAIFVSIFMIITNLLKQRNKMK